MRVILFKQVLAAVRLRKPAHKDAACWFFLADRCSTDSHIMLAGLVLAAVRLRKPAHKDAACRIILADRCF